jgi:hypothetical protein
MPFPWAQVHLLPSPVSRGQDPGLPHTPISSRDCPPPPFQVGISIFYLCNCHLSTIYRSHQDKKRQHKNSHSAAFRRGGGGGTTKSSNFLSFLFQKEVNDPRIVRLLQRALQQLTGLSLEVLWGQGPGPSIPQRHHHPTSPPPPPPPRGEFVTRPTQKRGLRFQSQD